MYFPNKHKEKKETFLSIKLKCDHLLLFLFNFYFSLRIHSKRMCKKLKSLNYTINLASQKRCIWKWVGAQFVCYITHQSKTCSQTFISDIHTSSLIESAVYAYSGKETIGKSGLHTCKDNTQEVSLLPDSPFKKVTKNPIT